MEEGEEASDPTLLRRLSVASSWIIVAFLLSLALWDQVNGLTFCVALVNGSSASIPTILLAGVGALFAALAASRWVDKFRGGALIVLVFCGMGALGSLVLGAALYRAASTVPFYLLLAAPFAIGGLLATYLLLARAGRHNQVVVLCLAIGGFLVVCVATLLGVQASCGQIPLLAGTQSERFDSSWFAVVSLGVVVLGLWLGLSSRRDVWHRAATGLTLIGTISLLVILLVAFL